MMAKYYSFLQQLTWHILLQTFTIISTGTGNGLPVRHQAIINTSVTPLLTGPWVMKVQWNFDRKPQS